MPIILERYKGNDELQIHLSFHRDPRPGMRTVRCDSAELCVYSAAPEEKYRYSYDGEAGISGGAITCGQVPAFRGRLLPLSSHDGRPVS